MEQALVESMLADLKEAAAVRGVRRGVSRPLILMPSRLPYVHWLLSIVPGCDRLAVAWQFARDACRRKAARRPRCCTSALIPGWPCWRCVPIKRRSLAVLAALAMILLGVALEFSQKLVPGREFEIRDMFINGADVLTGIAFGILSRIVPVVSSSGSLHLDYLALAAHPPCRCSWLAWLILQVQARKIPAYRWSPESAWPLTQSGLAGHICVLDMAEQ